jgi:hypothetical protein
MTYIHRNVPPNPGDLPTFLRDELPEISRGTRFMVNLTAAQIAAPSATLLADREVIYRLSASPYTLYHSNGSALIPIGSGGAALSAKLQSLDAANTPGTFVKVVSATELGYAAEGLGSESSVPSRADVDGRFIRWFTSMPADTEPGTYGVLFASGYPGVPIVKTGGVWGFYEHALTFAQMLAISSPVAGMRVEVSTIAMGGDLGTRNLNATFRYDGTYWKPLTPIVLDAISAATTNVLNSSTDPLKLRNCAPPAGLFHPGAMLRWEYMSKPDALTGDTARIEIRDNGVAGTVMATHGSDSAGKQHGIAALWCQTANILTGGGNTVSSVDTGSSTTTQDVVTGAAFDGSRTLDMCVNWVTGGSDKNMALNLSHMVLYPYHTSGGFTPPPPPPAPTPPSMPMGTLTASGTARNGPGRYAGFKVTAGTGAVRVYNGPDSSYPLVHEVTSPVVDEWNYATGVDTSDSDTWTKMQSAYAVLAGTGQSVDYAFEDFVGSLYAEDVEATEKTRITADYTAGTVYWTAKSGAGTGAGTVGDPYNGARALSDAIAAGSVAPWSRIVFDDANGAVTIASDGADWPSTAAVSSGFSQGSARNGGTTDPRGIIFGDNMVATSKASKLWFDFGDGSTTSIDWSGASNINRRAWAGLRVQGEQIVITGLKIEPPNWSYIIDASTGATRIAGTSGDAELRSFENNGIIAFGNGNHIHNCHVVGDKTWSRYAIMNCVAEEGVTGASSGLRGSVSFCTATGCLSGMQVQTFGATGYDLEIPTGCDIHHNEFSDPGWGNSTWLDLSVSGSGNAAAHGNGIGIQGKFFGGVLIYANTITGGYQDGIAAGVAAGAVIADNYIYDLNRTSTRSHWAWNGSTWAVTTVANNVNSTAEGNGIKTGLRDKDRKSGATWLGTDGTAATGADSLFVAELRPIVVRNIIRNVNSSGITSNESNGGFIHANEIVDPQGAGILLVGSRGITDASQSREGNWYISHNFVKKTVTGGSSWVIRFESATNNTGRSWLYNNIFWPGASQNLAFVGSTYTATGAKNVWVQGTISGTYSTANDLTDSGSKTAAQAYVTSASGVKTSAGLPAANALRTAGTVTPQTGARTYGCYLDFRGVALHATTPCVGPCNAP